jgi:4-amino-4-deoxy-L-arabinose transferase-like glycosyltransferase
MALRHVGLLGILAVAALLRLGIATFSQHPEQYPDMQDFLYHANGILAGQYPERNVEGIYSFRAPLYPFLLAGVLRVFGERFVIVTLLQALAGVVLVYVVYLFARRLFDERAALISAGLAAVYPYLLAPIGYVQTESLYAVLALGGTFLFVTTVLPDRDGGTAARARAAVAGVLYGLAMLCRPSAMLVIVTWGLWVAGLVASRAREARKTMPAFVLMLACAAVVVLPWTVRNYLKFSELILVNNQAGEIFWLGNNPHYARLQHATTATEFQTTLRTIWAEAEAQRPLVEGLSPREIDRFWWDKGWRYAASSPREWRSLLAVKWVDFWRPWLNPVAHAHGTVVLSALFAVPVFVAGALGMARLACTGRYRHFGLFALMFVTSGVFFTLFHPTVRYRTPSVDVLLLSLAGVGAVALSAMWRKPAR